MSKIVLLHSDKNFKKVLSFQLKNGLGVDVLAHNSFEDFFGMIKLVTDINIIVVDFHSISMETAEEIVEHVEQSSFSTKIVFLGDSSISFEKEYIYYLVDLDWHKVLEQCGRILEIEPRSTAQTVKEFISYPIEKFKDLKTSCTDIYVRIKQKEDEYQYIKRIHAFDPIDPLLVPGYMCKGMQELFIPADFKENFENFMIDETVEHLLESEEANDVYFRIANESYEEFVSGITKVGFSKNNIKLAEAVVDSVEKVFNRGELGSLLSKLLKTKTSFAYKHCLLTSVVASEMVSMQEWANNSQKRLLGFVAFFHDISLASNPKLLYIHNNSDLTHSVLSAEEKDLVLKHAQKSAQLIVNYPEGPFGVDTIIKQHHGSPNGMGFPEAISLQISPLSIVFMIAEEFAIQYLLREDEEGKIQNIREYLLKRFNQTSCLKVVQSLFNVIQDQFDE